MGYLIGYYSITFLLTIYLQGAMRLDASHTGLLLIELSVPWFIIGPFSGRLVDRFSSPLLLAVGLSGQTVGLLLLGTLGVHLAIPVLTGALILISISNSFSWTSIAKMILETVPSRQAGTASGMFYTVNYASRAVTQTLVLILMKIGVSSRLVTQAMAGTEKIQSTNQIHALVGSIDISFGIFAAFTAIALITTLIFINTQRATPSKMAE